MMMSNEQISNAAVSSLKLGEDMAGQHDKIGYGNKKDDSPSQIPGMSSKQAANSNTSSPTKPKKRYRKAPQAPRRFRSPYILYSISKMEEYKKFKEYHVQVTSFSRQIASDWKTLPEEERKKWEEAARRDKLRYNAEKQIYTGPWQVPSGRSRKDPSAPKRPPSAFLFYSNTMRSKLKQKNPDLKNTEISKLLGQAWKNAPPEVRRPYIEREHRERAVYKERIAKWRKERKEQDRLSKQQHEAVTKHFMNSGILVTTNASSGTAAPLSSASNPPAGPAQKNFSTAEAVFGGPAQAFFNPQAAHSASTGLMSDPSSSLANVSQDSTDLLGSDDRSRPRLRKGPRPRSNDMLFSTSDLASSGSIMSETDGSDVSSSAIPLFGYDAEASNVDTITMSDNPLLPSFFNGDTKFDPPLALLE